MFNHFYIYARICLDAFISVLIKKNPKSDSLKQTSHYVRQRYDYSKSLHFFPPYSACFVCSLLKS